MRRLGIINRRSINYRDRLLSLREHNLIGLWPLDELAGTTAYDYSVYGHNGTAANVTVDAINFNYRGVASYFNGKTSVITLPVADLDAPFDPTQLTFIIWAQIAAAQWADGTTDFLASLGADASNRVFLAKNAGSLQWSYRAGGTVENLVLDVGAPTVWFCVGITVNKTADRVRWFYNGLQQGADETGLGVWVGALFNGFTAIGDGTGAGGGLPAHGNLAYCAIWNTELSHDEMWHIYEWGL
jgi:hypothetical protein